MRYDYYFTATEYEREYIEKCLNQIVEETLDRIKNNFFLEKIHTF